VILRADAPRIRVIRDGAAGSAVGGERRRIQLPVRRRACLVKVSWLDASPTLVRLTSVSDYDLGEEGRCIGDERDMEILMGGAGNVIHHKDPAAYDRPGDAL
jgi:hypothetical protein